MKHYDAVACGQRIRKQRETLTLTREQLAEQTGFTPKYIANLELGLRGMSLQTLTLLVNTLLTTSDYLLYGDQHNTQEYTQHTTIHLTSQECQLLDTILNKINHHNN
jgi:transcriptional regulator with XRE-family HTH domain